MCRITSYSVRTKQLNFNYSNLAQLHHDDDWRIAIHESGHAIAGVRYDCIFEYVEIGPNEHGEVVWITNPIDHTDEECTLEKLGNWQTIYAAGAAAENIVFNEIRRHSIRCDMICHLRVDKKRKEGMVDLFEFAIERAVGILSKTDVVRVAEDLSAKRKLQYGDVCGLIGVKPPWER